MLMNFARAAGLSVPSLIFLGAPSHILCTGCSHFLLPGAEILTLIPLDPARINLLRVDQAVTNPFRVDAATNKLL